MDYAKSFTFAFEDEAWLKKLGYAALICVVSMLLFFIPLGIFLLGYMLRTARNVIAGKKNPLPEMSELGEMFVDGLKFFVVYLVYSLPIILIYGLTFGFLIASGAIADSNGTINDDTFAAVSGIGFSLVYCLVLIYGLFLGIAQPAIIMQYLRHDGDIGKSLAIGEIWTILKENVVICLLFLLVSIGAGMLVSLATTLSFITICGWIVVYFAGLPWASAVPGHVIGQFYNEIEGGGFNEKSPEDLAFS